MRGLTRILLLNQYYPPASAPTGQVLQRLAEGLSEAGFHIDVVTGSAGYHPGDVPHPAGQQIAGTETAGVRVRRLPTTSPGSSVGRKLIGYLLFYTGVFLKLVGTRADLVVALTTPPYLSLLARLATKLRGGRHAHWVMDLYPDVMVAHGMLKSEGLVHRILRGLTRWGFGGKRCAAVIGLGPDMVEKLNGYLPAGREAVGIPLWGTADGVAKAEDIRVLRQNREWGASEVVFVYSGNMGLGHRFTEILEAARRCGQPGVRIAFFGQGKRRREVEAAVSEWTGTVPITLDEYVPRESLAAHLGAADVHLASLEPAWDGCMVPSKLQGIFAAGRPVLFTGSRTSSIGQWILESGAGWVCAPGDVEAHLAAINEARDPNLRAKMGAAALRFSGEHFDREKNIARIIGILTAGQRGEKKGAEKS